MSMEFNKRFHNCTLVESEHVAQMVHDLKGQQLSKMKNSLRVAIYEASMLCRSTVFYEMFQSYLVQKLTNPNYPLLLSEKDLRSLTSTKLNDRNEVAEKLMVMAHIIYIEDFGSFRHMTMRNVLVTDVAVEPFSTAGGNGTRNYCYLTPQQFLPFPPSCFVIVYKAAALAAETTAPFVYYTGHLFNDGERGVYLKLTTADKTCHFTTGDAVTILYPPPVAKFVVHQNVIYSIQNDLAVAQKLYPIQFPALVATSDVPPTVIENLDSVQSSVVRGILNQDPRNVIVVMGPRGSGKTFTLYKSIVELVKRGEVLGNLTKILVCAQSESAVDEIALLLLRDSSFQNDRFRRIYAPGTHSQYLIPGEFTAAKVYFSSGPRSMPYIPMNKGTCASFAVILCTISTACRLGCMEKKHFTHIMVDEAEYCLEMDSNIPVSLFANSETRVVYFGGTEKPVLRVPAHVIGIEQSSLTMTMTTIERFAEMKEYQENRGLCYKLNVNYRSHPIFAHYTSKLFHADPMESKFQGGQSWQQCQKFLWHLNYKHPMIFHVCNQGKENAIVMEGNTSYTNNAEITEVVEYVKRATWMEVNEAEIGVITPYQAQVAAIQKALQFAHPRVTVESVGGNLAREKSVIIFSSVRTSIPGIAGEPENLSVILSRPRDVLILIGSLEILSEVQKWREYGRMLAENNLIYDTDHAKDAAEFWKKRLACPQEPNLPK